MRQTSPLDIEKTYWLNGYSYVIGIDEVGRGCFAGPVVAGATLFDRKHQPIDGITDSKKLSALARNDLSKKICDQATSFGVGSASVEEINELGIVPATFLAMERALLQLPKIEIILVDGSLTPRFSQVNPTQIKTIIKGDLLSYSIAAASIIAKVWRDELMKELHQEFLPYNWEKNKGYGTLTHRQAIKKYGLTPHHRTLFCRKVLNRFPSSGE